MKLDIVIPAAGLGRRMKSYGPKSLIPIRGETVLSRQLRLLKAAFPQSKITVVAGFESARLRRTLPRSIRFRLNEEYEETNVAHSIRLGIEGTDANRSCLVVYGDLVFNSHALAVIPRKGSSILVESGEGREQEVGVNVVDGVAGCFSFGLSLKWAHVVMLAPPEKQLFLEACRAVHRRRYYGYEILNEVIDRGGVFQVVGSPLLQVAEIDQSRDIEKALLVH